MDVSSEEVLSEKGLSKKYIFLSTTGLFLVVVFAVSLWGWRLTTPPENFPLQTHIVIPEGASLNDISHLLAREHVVRSAFLFRAVVVFYGKAEALRAGPHMFSAPLSAFGVARSFAMHESVVPPVRITIPEGSTLKDFDRIISDALPAVAPGDIIKVVGEKEGILFPDTYLVPEDASVEKIVTLLSETFVQKLAPLQERIAETGLSEKDIIALASLVEKEGNSTESMQMVASVFLHRIEIGMPLQADAVFTYLLGKTSEELTLADLEIDSPLNTYNNRGIPPYAIGSPGLTAIEAVLNATSTKYLYYLSDKEGVFHYAETFDEHKKNKARYLR